MVARTYMAARPGRPSAAKTAFDQRLIPGLIDGAAMIEAGLERLSTAARRAPVTAAACALATGLAFGARTGGGGAATLARRVSSVCVAIGAVPGAMPRSRTAPRR